MHLHAGIHTLKTVSANDHADGYIFFGVNLQLRNAVSTLAREGFVSLHGDTVKRV